MYLRRKESSIFMVFGCSKVMIFHILGLQILMMLTTMIGKKLISMTKFKRNSFLISGLGNLMMNLVEEVPLLVERLMVCKSEINKIISSKISLLNTHLSNIFLFNP